jgi:hypothetical protein
MKVGLDVDGVLANFYLTTCNKYGAPYEKVTKWEVPVIETNLSEIIEDKDFWDDLIVLNHPEKLTFDFDYYITAIPNNMLDSRIEWLEKHGFPKKPVIVAEDKLTVCRELGVKVLIDDKPSTLQEFSNNEDVVGIHYISNMFDLGNHGDYQVRCLTEVNDILTKLKN